jgi:hypothetical protein
MRPAWARSRYDRPAARACPTNPCHDRAGGQGQPGLGSDQGSPAARRPATPRRVCRRRQHHPWRGRPAADGLTRVRRRDGPAASHRFRRCLSCVPTAPVRPLAARRHWRHGGTGGTATLAARRHWRHGDTGGTATLAAPRHEGRAARGRSRSVPPPFRRDRLRGGLRPRIGPPPTRCTTSARSRTARTRPCVASRSVLHLPAASRATVSWTQAYRLPAHHLTRARRRPAVTAPSAIAGPPAPRPDHRTSGATAPRRAPFRGRRTRPVVLGRASVTAGAALGWLGHGC